MTVLDRDGAQLHFEQTAERPGRLPLLLSHGFASSSSMWAPNLAALSADRKVITWDIRGHGRSDSPADPAAYSAQLCVDDMVAVLDACGVELAALGGLSLGGFLSLACTVAHPGRVGALVLVDTGPGYRSDRGRDRWNRYAVAQAASFEAEGLAALRDSREVTGAAHDPAGLALAARGILVQHSSEVIDSLASLAVPTLVIVGEEDTPFLAAADHMAASIPGARKVVLEGAGHASNLDRPAAFDEAVTSFLSTVG